MASKRIALSAQIQNILHERILNNTYQKDELLPSESALCEEFGVSRTTIRDAISALAEKGFVRREQGKGIRVIDNTDSVVSRSLRNMMLLGDYTVLEFFETREMIERQMAYFAAKRASREQIRKLEESIARMEEHADDTEKYVTYDLEFHKEIALASQNKLLITVYDAMLPMLRQIVHEVVESTGTIEAECGFHKKILECIRNGDSQGAQTKTTEHDKGSAKMYEDAIQKAANLDMIVDMVSVK